jgi:hypothetical protein
MPPMQMCNTTASAHSSTSLPTVPHPLPQLSHTDRAIADGAVNAAVAALSEHSANGEVVAQACRVLHALSLAHGLSGAISPLLA